MGKTGKIANYEDIRQLPPKVRQMYIAVIQMLEEGADPANIRVSTITEKAGIGKGTAYEYFDSKEEIVAGAIVYQVQCVFDWLGSALEEKAGFREQIQFLLDEIEKKDGQKNCFFRFFHMMADNSEFSLLVREKMMTEAFLPGLPTSVFAKMLQRGVERGDSHGLHDTLCVFPSVDLHACHHFGGAFQNRYGFHTLNGIPGDTE